MDKKIKAIPFTDRIRNDKYRHKVKNISKLPCCMPFEEDTLDEDNNVVVRKTVYKEFDASANNKYKVTDFRLENLIAIGATDLNPLALSRDSLSASDHIENQLKNV